MAKYHSIKFCKYCNKSFHAFNPNQKYCSTPCRFWDKVDIKGPDDCWEWQACIRSHTNWPYGHFAVTSKIIYNSHRFVWELTHGPIPKGLFVLHHCDNPPCVNPKHLFLGTDQDNMDDMYNKGREKHPNGEENGYSKLNEKDIIAIRILLDHGEPLRKIAKKFGVVFSTIGTIKNRKTWGHVM